MDETRANAALTELNNINQTLVQRCINLAGELASAQTELAQLKEQKNADGNS